MDEKPASTPEPVEPVFYTTKTGRWKVFVGVSKLVFLILMAAGLIVSLAVVFPTSFERFRLEADKSAYRKVLDPDRVAILTHKANLAFDRIRDKLPNEAEIDYNRPVGDAPVAAAPIRRPIRAEFLLDDDEDTWCSLLAHVKDLNLVYPTWLFLPDTGGNVVEKIDPRQLHLLRSHKMPIMAVLSDNVAGRRDGGNAHRMLDDADERDGITSSVLAVLRRERFAGVNVCMPDLWRVDYPHCIELIRELEERLKPEGFLVAVSVPVRRGYPGLAEMAAAADQVVLLAHDYHAADTGPGPIAPSDWVQARLDEVLRQVPREKLVVSVATHGYIWPDEEAGRDMSYDEAVVTAEDENVPVTFDTRDAALRASFQETRWMRREIWCADAVTVYNTMRLAADRGIAGTALWSTGGEDDRIWSFHSRDMTTESLAKNPVPMAALEEPTAAADVAYKGEGEVLEVIARPALGKVSLRMDPDRQVITSEQYRELPSPFIVRRYGKQPRKILLSFDDGPDAVYTPQILDVLDREDVKATFFVIGINAEKNLPILRRMYEDGHEIGNHTFTHPDLSQVGAGRVTFELSATRRLIECVTGHSTVLFRPPFHADSEPERAVELLPVLEAQNQRYLTIGESIDPCDWEPGVTEKLIRDRIVEQQGFGNVVLLHDAGGKRAETVKALPGIIRQFRAEGYQFVTVADIIGKTRDDVMPPLASVTDRLLAAFNWHVASLMADGVWLLSVFFFATIVLSIARTVLIAILAYIEKRIVARRPPPPDSWRPLVSVIVPAFNEEVTCNATIATLLSSDYPSLEIVFVDDGSKDHTVATVRGAYGNDPRVRVITKPNGGKASALNVGIANATADYIVCIDADTQLLPDAISVLMRGFTSPEVVAVAGNVKVGNETNLLTKWQAIEYITSQGFDRRAFDLLNAIMVIPGAIGAFRKDAVVRIGGFSVDTLAEDCDLTVRLLRDGGVIRYQSGAVALTEAPRTLRMFMKQRFRWTFGIMQTIWKHKDAAFSMRYRGLGLVALPNAILFQYGLTLIAPFADIGMVISLFAGYWRETLGYYVAFTVIDLIGAAVAFRFEREHLGRLWVLIPQRFVYRQLMYFTVFRAVLTAIKGSLVGWNVLKRTGDVKAVTTGNGAAS